MELSFWNNLTKHGNRAIACRQLFEAETVEHENTWQSLAGVICKNDVCHLPNVVASIFVGKILGWTRTIIKRRAMCN